ncbi:unnamed protein product [Bemisia tabaci]|uniref:Kelch domain-containing protein 10 n=1 Tax=Bemisia tabaci TaxID=7038 RepID=A0A9P0F7U6_BEMTA|nr:unnamed protein product [Bemisia tabaci]
MGSVFDRSYSTVNCNSVMPETDTKNLSEEIGVKILSYSQHSWDSECAPLPRSGHRVACDDKYLYSFGGYNPNIGTNVHPEWTPDRPLFRELWRYNILTHRWKKLPVQNIPRILASSSVVLSGTVLFVFGGTGAPFGEECSRDLYVCNLAQKDEELSFQVVPTTGDLPEPLYGQGVLLDQNYLYTVGGTSGYIFSNEIYRLDLGTQVWEHLKVQNPQSAPDARYRHELALYKGEIYMFGGGVNDSAFDLKKIPVFNPNKREWRTITTFPCKKGYPERRKSHSLVQVPSQPNLIIICGGNHGLEQHQDTWMFNIKSRHWHCLPLCSLTFGLHFHDSAITPSGKMITFGGIKSRIRSRREEERINDVYSAWVCIPPLSELCLEILVEAVPSLKSLSLDSLKEMGLPEKFLRRFIDNENTC